MTKEQYEAQRKALMDSAQELLNSGDLEGCKAKQAEIMDLDSKFEKVGLEQANLNALLNTINRNGLLTPNGLFNATGTTEENKTVVDKLENQKVAQNVTRKNKFATEEYRMAYMDNVLKGTPIPEKYNTDAFTTITEAAAVIPTTIVEEVIREMKTYGQLYARVRKLNVKGGVSFPISSLVPVATWITEGTPSDKQKVDMSTNVSFLYYGLECKIATSLLANEVSLASFETTMVTLITEAMIKAIDLAIVKGTGVASPTGITVDTRVSADQVITLSADDFKTWSGWKKEVFAKIPLSYRAGGTFIMASGTFDGYIDGMVDSTGQPIGRVNYGITDGVQERFGGKEVILVEDDVVADYETAAAGDVVAIYAKLGDYAINSNLQMATYRWLDQDLNQYINKAIMIADGKLLDTNGVLIIKKGE
ncbi:MAG: phage major capsid protein [Sphaerochaetaceae bacterium]|nr:phage major capsid protein [Sphaerochaetaceae bacterium]